MNEAEKWLKSGRDYQSGIAIYNRFKISNKHDAFFSQVNDASSGTLHHQMLVIQIQKISRKQGGRIPDQVKQLVKPIEIAEIQTGGKSIITVDSIRENKTMVNRLLTMRWTDLSKGEKEAFYNDERYFAEKVAAMHDISRLKNEMHLADAKRKVAKSVPERKKWNDAVVSLGNRIKDCFKKKIDNWAPPTDVEDSPKDAIMRERRIRYLEGTAIPRAKTELKSDKLTEQQRFTRIENIDKWTKELSELKLKHIV